MKGITEIEFNKLNEYVQNNEKLRITTKDNLLKTFTLLFYSGCRIGELFQLRNKDLINVEKNGELHFRRKSSNEYRKIIFTDDGISVISNLNRKYNVKNEDLDAYVLRAKGVTNVSPNQTTYAGMFNRVVRDCLGKEYGSHSFRSGFISELLNAGVNTKLIRDAMGHKNTSSTNHYLKYAQKNIKDALLR